MWMEHWSHWSLYQLTKYNFMLSQIFMEHWHFNMWFSLKYMYLVLSKFLVPGGHLSRHSHICRKKCTYFFQTSTDSYFYHLIHWQWPVPCWVCFPFGPGLVPSSDKILVLSLQLDPSCNVGPQCFVCWSSPQQYSSYK